MKDNEGVRVRDVPHCMICGKEGELLYGGLRDHLYGAPGIWTLMRCHRCQLVWLNPQPITEEIGKLYTNYHTHKVNNARTRSPSILRKLIRASILECSFNYRVEGSNRMLGSVLNLIGPLKKMVGRGVMWLENEDGGLLLDVGCGSGRFLHQMSQLGWESEGVEPDNKAVLAAHEAYGIKIFNGFVEEVGFPDEHFDAITMNNVIEHVPDPVGLLRECRRILKPSGKLVVITPNINSFGHQFFGEYWRGLEIPRHLYIFSTHSLRNSSEAALMNVQEQWTTAITARWMWAKSSLIRRHDEFHPFPVCEQRELQELHGLSHRLQGLGFYAIELAAAACLYSEAGEAQIMIARR